MNKLLYKGKVLISLVSVFAILAVSMLSMFTGNTAIISSAADDTETVVSYPISGSYDADVVFKEGGIDYVDANSANKTEVSDFTAFDTTFWLTAEGDGTAANPFIIENANQFAAVATNNLVYDEGVATTLNISRYTFITVGNEKILDTKGISFKVADNVKAFNMNNTDSAVDFSGDMTAEQVKTALEGATIKPELSWAVKTAFKGRFDGNGVVIYGLKGMGGNDGGLFPKVEGLSIRNTTIKNSYFYGDSAGALVGNCSTPDGVIVENCAVINNYVLVNRLNGSYSNGGVVLGKATSTEASGWTSGSFSMVNSLVVGNIAEHTKISKDWQGNPYHNNEYDFTYGVFPAITHKDGVSISNSIVMDSAPFGMVYASRGFTESKYSSVYTNMVDVTIENIDYNNSGAVRIDEITKLETTATGFKHTYKRDASDNNSEADWSRDLAAGTFIKIDSAAAKGADAEAAMPDLDWSKWTVNADGYPMPKVYQIREYSAGAAWTGDVALLYSGGDGSSASPYIINTAEEFVLMLTTAKSGEQFVLGADIVINDTTAANWTDNAKQWFTSNDIPAFEGTLDGNGHSVSGLYYSGDQEGEAAGLIPTLGSKAIVKNLTVKDSVLNGKEGQNIGAISGFVVDNCGQIITVKTVVIEDTVKFEGDAAFGGIIGKIGYSYAKISDSISKSNGLFSKTTGQAEVKRSISVGAYPFTDATDVVAEGVYTDTEGLTVDGVTVISNANMKGDAAATAMSGLNFPNSWQVVADDYPYATGVEGSANGVKGEVWTGAIADSFAGGDGTPENPYIIETAEQLALCVSKPVEGKKYKLAADIYLNDINGKLWKDKIGCVEWFNQYQAQNYTKDITLDGDGYVIFGLYLNNTNGTEYYRAGLFPQLSQGAVIKNVGISQAYLLGNLEFGNEAIGAIAGTITTWQTADAPREIIRSIIGDELLEQYKDYGYLPDNDAALTRKITSNPEFFAMMPKIQNCFVDHTCYISGHNAGGLVGATGGAYKFEDCVVTANVVGSSNGAAFIANDYGFGGIIEDCLALTQNCVKPATGGGHSDWRSKPEWYCAEIIDSYYFSIRSMMNPSFVKISKPDDRIGDAAKDKMTGLDWAGDDEDGTEDVWTVIADGTPLQTIFAKNRSQEQFESFSDKNFTPPNVTVTLSTGTDEIDYEPLVGSMYFKMSLPTPPDRIGYKFTGWYVFDDMSLEYPYDYFPPRDLTLFAGWEAVGVIQDFESYTDTIWDYDDNCWRLNKPGARGGYQNQYVRTGSKSMHLLDVNTAPSDCLLNYEDMLVPGQAYTMTFWVTTDKENNPPTLISLVHNEKPDYLDTAVALEDMAVVTGLTAGEWVQYSYSFTAKTKWVSLRATGGSSLYFDDIIMASIDGTLSGGTVVNVGSGVISPNTGESVSVAVLVSAIMLGAITVVVSRKNLVETIED